MLHVGVLTPHGSAGADAEFEDMTGGQVLTSVSRISVSGDRAAPTTPEGLRAHAHPPVVQAAAAELHPERLDAITYASTSTAYVLGPAREGALIEALSERWSLPVCSTPASTVDALRTFDVERLAVVHPPWFGEDRNRLGAAYFADQGFTVVQAELAAVADDPDLVEPGRIVDWITSNIDPEAEAVFLGGNGFRAARALADLEERLGCLVLESNQVLLWSILLGAPTAPHIRGFGRLLDTIKQPSKRQSGAQGVD